MKHFLLSPLLFAASVCLGPTAFGQQQATFAVQTPSASTGAISRPSSVTVADVNGDGRPDALVANTANAGLGVLLGNGTGGFNLRSNQAIPGASIYLSNVAVADVNGDSKLDVLMCATTYSSTNPSNLFVLLGNGAGDFTPAGATSTGTNSQPSSVVVADVNADGKLDALVTDYKSSLLVLLGTGTGEFILQAAAPSTGAGSGSKSVAVADVNGDGKLDALTANAFDGTIRVLLGNGSGGFTLQANSPVVGPDGSTQSLVVVDVNKDGKLDVLAGNSGDNTLAVLLGNGAGGFAFYGGFPTTGGSVPLNVDVADVNGDGNLDALTTNYDNTISVLLGNGSGGFTAQTTRLVPVTPLNNIFGLSLADVNKDGRPDVTAVNMANNTLVVFLNTSTTILSTRAVLPGASAYFYPNPAHTATILSLTGLPQSVAQVNATLLDVMGRVVGRYRLNATGGSLPLASLAPGLYVVRLIARNNQGRELGELPAQRVHVE